MLTKKKDVLRTGIVMLCLAMVMGINTGCGEQVLGSKETAFNRAGGSLDDRLDDAREPRDFAEIVRLADAIISSTSNATTSADRKAAYAAKGEAKLGEHGISISDVFADLSQLADAGGSSGVTANIIDLIKVADNVTLNALVDSATAYNLAQALVGVSQITVQNTAVPSLNSSQSLARGISNMLVAIKIIKNVYNVQKNGTATVKDSTKTSYQNLSALFSPLNLHTYATNAIQGITEANSLKANQVAEASRVQTATAQLQTLNTEAAKSSGTFTFNSTNYAVGRNDSNEATNIENAITAIFKSITR